MKTRMPVLKHKSWRDAMSVHPATALFPIISDAELDELGEDIRRNGLQQPITILRKSNDDELLLDGRNRLDALERVGIKFYLQRRKHGKWDLKILEDGVPTASIELVHTVDDSVDPYAYVMGANIHRRHLTSEQKRELIAKLLKENPVRSNLATATLAHADDKTVASVRKDLEARSEIPNVATRTDSTKRQQPATKPKVKIEAANVATATERAKLDNVAKHANFMEPGEPKSEPDPCPGGEVGTSAMAALCSLIAAAGRDLLLAEHLTTMIAAQIDPFPAAAIDTVIALLTDISARLRFKEVEAAQPATAVPDPASELVAGNDPGPMPAFLRRSLNAPAQATK
jgi:ParB-like nuclease domain